MNTAPHLTKEIFWDVDFDHLDFDKHARFVIGRVLMRGTLEDWFEIKRYYGPERIKKEATQLRYFDKKTLSFCSVYFDVPRAKFRCFIEPPSIKKLWNY